MLVNPGLKDQYTRCGHQTYTRIDRVYVYAAEYYSTWRILLHVTGAGARRVAWPRLIISY
eukprot:scaffold153696_cov39-Tisochrysis_lutea.AAC.1